MNEPTTIVLADDHSLFREGILLVLKKEKSIVIAGEAENGEALLQLIDEVNPDVVITDIDMPVKKWNCGYKNCKTATAPNRSISTYHV